MAKIDAPFPFEGKWGGMSVYYLRGVGLVGRTGSGPTPEEMKTAGHYELPRRHGKEFGGCSRASKYLRRNFRALEPARDHNLSSEVTEWLQAYLPYDGVSPLGQRHIQLSKAPRLLEGINLSEKHPFDSVVRGGLTYELSREELAARIDLPALLPGVTFLPTGKQPYFRVMATLGVAPDLLWQGEGYSFHRAYEGFRPAVAESAWTPTAEGSEAMSLQLQVPYAPPDDHFALVMTVGILMGTIGRRGQVEAVKYAGCAKVLAAG